MNLDQVKVIGNINIASGQGTGGIYFGGASGVVTNSLIQVNRGSDGGGVYLGANAAVNFTSTTIMANYASRKGGGIFMDGGK